MSSLTNKDFSNGSTNGNADIDGASSLLEQLQLYNQQKEADLQLHRQQDLASLTAFNAHLNQPNQFNYEKVPKAIRDHTRSLPIFARKDELIEKLRQNQVVIVEGDTGSGKSTQIPQYLVEAGFAESGVIGITQPRRVAAKALAERVAKEGGVKVGGLVGYAVRFDKCVGGLTTIKFMTDGLLVNECAQEPNFSGYSVIIIDEAHERSISTDVCLGLLKRALKTRKDLKVIISSATLDRKRFSEHFDGAPVFKVEGRMHPVEIIHRSFPVGDCIGTVVDTVAKIHGGQIEGDVLVFLAGQDEIENVWEKLEERAHFYPSKQMMIIPCYSGLPFEEQQRIFEETPKNCRKIVLATNIAETSLTIEGIVFVVDSGHFKQNRYNPYTKIDTLERKPITKFQAIQRAGRAGRTRPGTCYRMYSEQEFCRFQDYPEPEIQRSNVESVILTLMSMGVTNPSTFEFIDALPRDSMLEGLNHLQELSAVDKTLKVTPLGMTMARFPLEPPLSRVLIESANLNCSSQVIKIVAMLSAQHQNIFLRGKKVRTQADKKRALFNQPEGDYLTLLKIHDAWVLNHKDQRWCKDNYIQHRILEEAEDIRIQLTDIFNKYRYFISSGRTEDPLVRTSIRKAFTSGFFRHLAKKQPTGHAFLALNPHGGNREVFLHPTSALFSKKPSDPWLIFHEVMVTTKAFMRGATVIEKDWVKEYAPVFAEKISGHLIF